MGFGELKGEYRGSLAVITVWKIITILGSRTLTLWLMGIFILGYLTVAVWSKEAFGTFVVALTENSPVIAAYLLFSINILLRGVVVVGSMWGQKSRLMLRLPVYAGAVIVLFSFFFSLNLRAHQWMIVGEGDVFQLAWEEAPFRVVQVDAPIKKQMLVLEKSTLFAYEPTVTIEDRTGVIRIVGAFPPAQVGSSLLHIMNFGVGPGVELRDGNEVLKRGAVALRLIPFGNVDTFEIPHYPYKFSISILPTKIVKKGRETARDYDLSKPRYRIEVMKGDRMIVQAESEEGVMLDEGMSLWFFPPAAWVHLEAVYDPFRTYLIIGLALLAAGLPLRLVGLFLERDHS